MSSEPYVRLGRRQDLEAISRQMASLWPDGSLEEHRQWALAILDGAPQSTMPLVLFVAEIQDVVAGFMEVGLRSHADGCDPSRAVGFVEGWYVEPDHRRSGVGRALMSAAEDWARERGCREIASDTWIDAEVSQRAHVGLGFEVVDRVINFKKTLT